MAYIKRNEINVTVHPSDGYTLWALVNGFLFQRRYIGYTLAQAKAKFLAEAECNV